MDALFLTNEPALALVKASGEEPRFNVGERVLISVRYPIGHYRAPVYIRGKEAVVEAVIKPAAVNNEEEGFGRNAGSKLHYYRVGIPLVDLWPEYTGFPDDQLRIEIFETWLTSVTTKHESE
jgi:nitrile hydratase